MGIFENAKRDIKRVMKISTKSGDLNDMFKAFLDVQTNEMIGAGNLRSLYHKNPGDSITINGKDAYGDSFTVTLDSLDGTEKNITPAAMKELLGDKGLVESFVCSLNCKDFYNDSRELIVRYGLSEGPFVSVEYVINNAKKRAEVYLASGRPGFYKTDIIATSQQLRECLKKYDATVEYV